jgi:hypothetical protein
MNEPDGDNSELGALMMDSRNLNEFLSVPQLDMSDILKMSCGISCKRLGTD